MRNNNLKSTRHTQGGYAIIYIETKMRNNEKNKCNKKLKIRR